MSVAATVSYRGPAGNETGPWWLIETAGLLALLVPTARAAVGGRGWTRCAVTVTAVAVLPLRIALWLEPPSDPAETAVVCGMASIAALAALTAGRYLRALDRRRAVAVAEARRAQRLALARDLHDFVAHEVSGMLAQAQAGQVVAATDAHRAVATLRRIEEAGLRAMATLDRTVRMLDEEAREPCAGERPQPALAELAAVVARFREGSAASVDMELDPHVREVPALAHRVVTEALTNVRRHAPGAAWVRVAVRRTDGTLSVSVVNDVRADGSGSPAVLPGGGLGLAALRSRLTAEAATLTAGRTRTGGWRTVATWPEDGTRGRTGR